MQSSTKEGRAGAWCLDLRPVVIAVALGAVLSLPVRAADMTVNIDNFTFTQMSSP